MEQAALFLKFARATTDPALAAGLLDKAVKFEADAENAPDQSLKAPDVQPEK